MEFHRHSLSRLLGATLALLTTAITPAAWGADAVDNGGFESGAGLPSGGHCYIDNTSCAVDRWTSSGVQIASASAAWGYPDQLANANGSLGGAVIGLQNASEIAQTLSFSAPGQYELTWWDAGRSSFFNAEYAVLLDSQTLGTFTTSPGQGWAQHTLNISITQAGSALLQFSGHAVSPDGTAFLDNVSLNALPAPVPEPALALLFASGLAMLGVRRRNAQLAPTP